jgi:predicted lipoprotein with Yx(FWY)xxD motif
MNKLKQTTLRWATLFALSVSIIIACDSEDEANKPALVGVELRTSTTFGNYLTDTNGKSLYFFASDADGTSACSGNCATTWPPYYLESTTIPAGLLAADFGSITRADGKKQSTYKGWPLYYFSGDDAANEITGDGTGEVWFVAKPDYIVMVAKVNGITYLVGAKGKTVYSFDNDTDNTSNCSGGCATTWPPYFYGDALIVPSLLDATDFGTITRGDGSKQHTFLSMPIYLYSDDTNRGTTNGDGVGGVWHIVPTSAGI